MFMQGIFKIFHCVVHFSNNRNTQAPLCNALHFTNFSHRYEVTWLSASWEPCYRTHRHIKIQKQCLSSSFFYKDAALFTAISTPGLAIDYFTVYCPLSYYRNCNRNRKLELFVQKQSCSRCSIQEGGRNECRQ